MSRSQVAPDPNPAVVKSTTEVTTGEWSQDIHRHSATSSDALSIETKATRASTSVRCCSPVLCICLLLELGVIIASVVVLATLGSGDGITIRTDIGALICGSIILLGMLLLALMEILISGCSSSKEVVLVYLQIAIHLNAVGLGAMALLGHATWLLVNCLMTAAAFAWVVTCCGATVNLWHWLYYLQVDPKPRLGFRTTVCLGLPYKTAFLAWAILVALAVSALVFPKLPDTLGLSVEIAIAEHVLLIGVGGVFCSSIVSPVLLAVSRRGRRFLSKAAGRRKNLCLRILMVFVWSVVLHLVTALLIPLLAHILIFAVALLLVWSLVSLTRCARRRAIRPGTTRKSVVPVLCFAPCVGLFKVMAFMALFLFDCAFLERFTTDGQAYVLVQQEGSCGERGDLLTDAALDAMDCARHAQQTAATAFALSHTGDCYSYRMTVSNSDYIKFRDQGTNSTCTEGFYVWNALPNYDFYVMQPSSQFECPFGINSGGARHRDKRRLAVVSGGVVSPVGGSSLIPAGIEQMFTALGMAPVGQGLRSATELYMQGVRAVLAPEPFIPKVVPLKCAGLRRLASACMLLAGLLLMSSLSSFDLLNVMAASQDITAARAAGSGSYISYLSIVTAGQLLQKLVLMIFQVVIAASVQMRYEAIGAFEPRCGYLVGPDDLEGLSCPSWWHAPVDALAIVVLIFGFFLCFVLILLVPFRRFVASPAARWATAAIFKRSLRRPLLWPSKLPEVLKLPFWAWPISSVMTSLGVWNEALVEIEQCSGRLEWLDPMPREAEKTPEGPEASGANFDLVSQRAMTDSSKWLCAFAWLPMPLVGPVMFTATMYLNRHRIFTFGCVEDANHSQVGGALDSVFSRDQNLLRYQLQEAPLPIQVLKWICSCVMFLFMLLIQLAPGDSLDDRVSTISLFLALGLVMAVFFCIAELVESRNRFQAAQNVISSCEDLFSVGPEPLKPSEDGDPLQGLTPMDRFRVKRAFREMQQLPWIREGRLPATVYSWLSSRGIHCNVGELALAMFHRQRDYERHLEVHPEKNPEVPPGVLLATKVLLLRAAAHNDLCILEAQEAAKQKAHGLAMEAATKRAQAFQQWCQRKASVRAAAAANALLMAFQEKDTSQARRKRPLWMRFCFSGSTEAVVSVLPSARRRILEPQEARYGISVWGYVHLEWPTDKEDVFTHQDAAVSHVDFAIEKPAAKGGPEDVMPLPSLEGSPPEPSEAKVSTSLDWWEEHFGLTVNLADPKEAFRLQAGSPQFVVRQQHLDLAATLPEQEECVTQLMPFSLTREAKDEQLHVLWSHAVQADERLTGAVQEDSMITQLEDAIRASAWPSRTWMLAGVFFAALAESLGRSGFGAEEAARRAMLLGICAKLMAKQGRRRDAHARELDLMEIESEGGAAMDSVEEMAPLVSFKNFKTDLSEQPASPTSTATQVLREALGRTPVDIEELSMALEHARRADVDAMLLQRGEEIFMNIIEKQGAVTRLATAIQNRMLKELRAAVQKAEQVQLQPNEYPDADGCGILQRAHDVVREEELAALEELKSAMKSGGALRLQRALAQAEEAHVQQHHGGAEVMLMARQKLEAIARKKQSIALLKVALESGNVGLLEAAITECEREGVEGEVNLDTARKRLATLRAAAQRLKAGSPKGTQSPKVEERARPQTPPETPEERAANMLKAALCHEPLDAKLLRLALQEAIAVGLQGDDVRRAQELLRAAESKEQALEEVRRAGAERNAQALAAAIKRCRKLGIAPQELLQALQQLTDEMAKVAKIAGDHGISNLMLEDVEQTRRELHDKVQAVRGGVRVICRIRPFVEDDDAEDDTRPAVEQVDLHTLKLSTNKMNQLPSNDPAKFEEFQGAINFGDLPSSSAPSNAPSNGPSNKVSEASSNFRFNGRVLGPRSSQEEVFAEVQGLVQSTVDGYNVLFAAGGSKFSGKSYTIFGPPSQKIAPGMPRERDWSGLASRVVNEIFAIQERDDWRALLEVEVQMVEVRGDRTLDLLGRASRPELNEHHSGGHLAFAGAMLLGGGGEGIYVEGASSRRVADSREFMRALNSAFGASEGPYATPKSPRTPASTVSSARGEAHAIVVLHLTRTNRASGVAVRSKLVLADLAPMSSPVVGGTIGSTSKEVAAAYHSLEAIIKAGRRDGQAAAQSTARRKHVLGQILRDCLCGNARPVFLMTLSPSPVEKVHTSHAVTFATALGGRAAR